MTEQVHRTRVILIGGDAHRLRALRVFLDQLGVFEAVAIATGGAGLNALTRQPWAAAVLIDDLTDMSPEQVVADGRRAGYRGPFVALTLVHDRVHQSQLYASGIAEIVAIGPGAPTPEVARALVRTIERQQLLDRIAELEAQIGRQRLVDDETGLYTALRFDEEWRSEQARAHRRGGDLALLTVRLETTPDLSLMPARDRTSALRSTARAVRAVLRDGDVASHDGNGVYRILMSDASPTAAAEASARISQGIRQAFAQSGLQAAARIDVDDGKAGPAGST